MVRRKLRQRRRGGFADWRCIVSATALCALLLLPALTAFGEDEDAKKDAYTWRVGVKKGLDVHGVSCLRIHPKAPGTLWAHVHGLGPARSENGGETWLPMLKGIPDAMRPGLRSQVRISMDPRDAKVLYLVSDGQIFRSADSGANWESITTGALASLSWDRRESRHLSWEVRVDQKKGVRLLVGTRNDGNHNGALHQSTDGGKSWEEIAGTAIPKSNLGADTLFVRLDPKTEKVITVAGREAVYFSDDRGRTFERSDPGGAGIRDIRGLSDVVGKELYLADARGIWRSKNVGAKWDKKPLAAGDALGVFTDPHSKKRLYAIWHDRGLEISEDGGHKRWAPFGGTYTDPAQASEKDEGAKDDAAKDDAGKDEAAPGYFGAVIREVYGHPKNKKTIYLASPATGLHVSTDGGKSFQRVVPPADHDPDADEKIMPAVTPAMALVGVHPARNGLHVAVSEHGVVYNSADRCETWQRVGLLGQAPGVLIPDNAEHAWLAGGRSLLRSTDDGKTWLPLYPPRDGKVTTDAEARIVSVWRGKPADAGPGTLRILFDRSGVIMTSKDDGVSWTASAAPAPISGSSETWAASMAVDPGNEEHIVLAARTTRRVWNAKDENGGVFESWDGGASWNDLSTGLRLGRKDTPEQKRAKAYWNHATFVTIDASARLIVYGADRRGILVRPFINPKGGKKLDRAPAWIDVTPAEPAMPTISAYVQAMTADVTDTRHFVQLRGRNDDTGCYDIAGRTLRAWYDSTDPAKKGEEKKDDAKPTPAWNVLPSPGAGVHLSAVAADAQLPGRLVATDSEGGHGILIFEIPGSKPEEPVKDEPKKDEPKKGAAGEGAGTGAQPPEGMRGFSAGQDKLIRVWAVDKGTAGAQVGGHTNAVFCIALTPDEAHVISGSEDRTLRLWNASNAKEVASIKLEGAARGIAVDDDSEFAYVAMGAANKVAKIEIATRKVAAAFEGHKKAVLCVATSEDTNRAYSGGEDDIIIVWDTQKGTEVNSIVLGSPVVALAVAADGSRVYAAGRDNSVAAFDATGKPAGRVDKLAASARSLSLAPDGGLLYATTENGVLAINTKDMSVATTHAASGAGALTCVATSADGVWIFAGDAKGGLWMWSKGRAAPFRGRVQGHEGPLHAICVTPDETELAADPEGLEPPPEKGDDPAKKDDGDAPKKDEGGAAPPKDAPPKDAPPPAPKKDDAPAKPPAKEGG